MSWTAILVLFAGAFGFKALGVFGLARLDDRAERGLGPARLGVFGWFPLVAGLVPAALFAALVAVQTLDVDGALRIDARVAGVGVAAVAVRRRAPFVVVVALAMAVTAAIRWQTSG